MICAQVPDIVNSMKPVYVALLFVALASLVGCSKKEAAAAAEPVSAKADAKGPVIDNAILDAELAELAKKIQAQQYDAAVGSLLTLKDVPKSEKEQAQFQGQLRDTAKGLAEKAAQGDQNARASYQMLGRMMMGR